MSLSYLMAHGQWPKLEPRSLVDTAGVPYWQGSITLEQVVALEERHAYLTPAGWAIPDWVHSLRRKVLVCHVYRRRGATRAASMASLLRGC